MIKEVDLTKAGDTVLLSKIEGKKFIKAGNAHLVIISSKGDGTSSCVSIGNNEHADNICMTTEIRSVHSKENSLHILMDMNDANNLVAIDMGQGDLRITVKPGLGFEELKAKIFLTGHLI